MKKRGFTLIELLVVIAIIAILAAILFPVFAKAREKARQSSCLSGMKRIGQAMATYAKDYDGHWPPAQTIGTPPKPIPPRLLLRRYALAAWEQDSTDSDKKFAALFSCASDCGREIPGLAVGGSKLPLSWGFREEALGSSDRAPSNNALMPVVLDCDSPTGLWNSTSITERKLEDYIKYINLAQYRHNDGFNVLFRDGHASWVGTANFVAKMGAQYTKPPTHSTQAEQPPIPARTFTLGQDGIVRDAKTGAPVGMIKK